MTEATKLAGRITITDETLKNEIIEYALRKIGTTSIGLLDGMTLVYQDRWYDITVENGNVTVDILQRSASEVIKIRPYRKSVIQTDGGYTQLWIAVINQAVNDYRNNPDMRSEVARFFKSEYFERMTGVSGQVVLDRLKKEVKQNKNNIKQPNGRRKNL